VGSGAGGESKEAAVKVRWAVARREALRRRARYVAALARPELRERGDGTVRAAGGGPTSPAVKVLDAETRRLIDAAIERRG